MSALHASTRAWPADAIVELEERIAIRAENAGRQPTPAEEKALRAWAEGNVRDAFDAIRTDAELLTLTDEGGPEGKLAQAELDRRATTLRCRLTHARQ